MDGKNIRLQRLIGDSRAVVIAFDHGLFDGPIPAMEDLRATAEMVNPLVDAVLLAPGMIRHCSGGIAGPKRPLVIARLNWNTVYCFRFNYQAAKSVYCGEPQDAFREGMDIALISLTLQTGDEHRDAANVEVFSHLCNTCHRLGIPVIGEYFPTRHMDATAEELHENVLVGSRIVAELGADAIKTFNTCRFDEIVNSCPVPVLGLGAEKLPTPKHALELAASVVTNGGGGVVFGRNAIQVPDPHAFQAALCDVVKGKSSVDKAVRTYRLA